MADLETEQTLFDRGAIEPTRRSTVPATQKIGKRFLLQWQVTEACNLRCAHCFDPHAGRAAGMPPGLREEVLGQFVSFLRGGGALGHVNFSGGEPFTDPGFPDLLEKTVRHAGIAGFAVLSNGTLIDRPTARFLSKLNCRFVQVSIEGGRKTHEAIRGAGTYDRALEAIGALRRAGVTAMVSFTAHRRNAPEVAEAAEASRRAGARVFWSDRLIPGGRGAALRDQMMSAEEVGAFFEDLFALRRRMSRRIFGRLDVRMHRALQFLTLVRHGVKGASPYRCPAGRSFLTVMSDGRIVPCRRMPIEVGDLRTSTLRGIFDSSVLLAHLRDSDRCVAGCEGCAYAKSCGGGLRCLSYAVFGDPFKSDPQCFVRAARGC